MDELAPSHSGGLEDPESFSPLCQTKKDQLEETTVYTPAVSYWQDAWRRLKQNKLAMFGLWTLACLLFMAIIGPFLSHYTYYETRLHLKNSAPSSTFWFGTDELGRDLFTRCWWGARISLFVGITASVIDLIIGVLYGAIAALLGGKAEEWMMRCADVLYAIPYLLVVILLMVIIGPGLTTIIIALTMTGWINMARIVRSQILQIKQMDFIKAAYALGAPRRRILLRHLIPNAMGPIIVTLTLTIPSAIFAEAFLSFLGLGVQAPIASWGTMANDGLSALRYYPWRLFFPAILISLTMLSFNLLGDGLRDAFDPRLRK
jgi:ABC-type dipeptide/oligopeptide/nickel transport system permease subunit